MADAGASSSAEADLREDTLMDGGAGDATIGALKARNPMRSVVDEEADGKRPDMMVVPERNLYPFSIVWGPLPCLTWCFPCVGHMGIGDSQGVVHDFAGPYTVNTDRFMVGPVTRYYQLGSAEMAKLGARGDPAKVWDAAIEEGDTEYRGLMHNLICQNCHHHSAQCTSNAGIRLNWFQAVAKVLLCGRWANPKLAVCTLAPFVVIVLLVVLLVLYA